MGGSIIGQAVPETSDGKPIFLPNIFRGDVDLYFPGEGDGLAEIGGGEPFQMSSDTAGETTITWRFRDWIYTAGGVMTYRGADLGDSITLSIYAPATVITANGSGTGNCTAVATGLGFNIVVPAAGNGTHDVNEVDKVPVPAGDGAGYWTWDTPDTGRGTISPKASGGYDLYDVPIPLVTWLRKMPLLGSNIVDYMLPAIKPKRILPHWTFKAELHNSGHAGLELCWVMFCARKKTL